MAGTAVAACFGSRTRRIVGGSLTTPVPRNEFLCAKKEFADFELRLKFKVLGAGANAGIQIRSRRIPDHHEMIGYQADLGDGWWGCLYDESRRNKVLAGPPDDVRAKIVKRDEWNDYRIRCQGRTDRIVDQWPENRGLHRNRQKHRAGRADRLADPRRPAQRSLVQGYSDQGTLI